MELPRLVRTGRGLLLTAVLLLAYLGVLYVVSPPSRTADSLAYERLVAERSPLLPLAGTDTDDLRAAIASLEKTADDLSLRQQDAHTADLVRRSLYPLQFLKAAAALEDARTRFITSGSAADAKRYEAAEMLAIREYLSDLARFRAAFAETVPANMGTYRTERYAISRDDVLRALDSLHNDMLRTRRLHDQRLACFHGALSECDERDVAIAEVSVPDAAKPTPAMLDAANVLREADRTVSPQLLAKDTSLYVLSKSSCISDDAGAYPYAFRTLPPLGLTPTTTTPYYAGDIRFLVSEQHRSLPYLAYFAQHGISYVVSRPWLYYDCQTPVGDSATVLALSDIRSFAASSTLSDLVSGPDAQRLRTLERRLNGDIVSERDVALYLNTLLELVSRDAVPAKFEPEIFALKSEMTDKSAGLYQAVLETARSEEVNMRLNDKSGVPVDFGAAYLFFTRSNFTSFFFAADTSAAGGTGALFPLQTNLEGETPYTYYSKADAAERRTMRSDLVFYVRLHFTR